MHIEGASAIVMGGASGLGEATARALAERGARVTVADLNEEKGNALAGEIGATFLKADVTNAEEVEAAVAAAAEARAGCGSPSTAPASAGPSGSATSAGRTTSRCSRRSSGST